MGKLSEQLLDGIHTLDCASQALARDAGLALRRELLQRRET